MKFKKIAAAILLIVMCLSLFVTSAFAAQQKNETVYASLNHDGSVKKIYVVNQLFGEYVDYGQYTNIKNLSTLSEPVVKGDKISFTDDYIEGGLYYQGTTEGELPMVFDIQYFLDGNKISGINLGGKTGHLKIEIEYKPNYLCEKRVRDGFMAQITLPLNMNTAGNINADGAANVVVGQTMNISYNIFPDESGKVYLEADISEFQMDPVSITLVKGAFSSSGIEDSISEFQDGFSDMLDGASEMVDGTSDLKDGITTLKDGVGSLSYGMSQLAENGDDMLSGMNQYSNGLGEYLDGIKSLSSSSSQIGAGLDELSANGKSVAEGISGINSGLGALSASSGGLKALALSLQSSADPSVSALANGTLEILGTLESLSGGLGSASSGLGEYTAGVSQTAQMYKQFDEGLSTAAANAGELKSGYDELKDGFALYSGGVKSSSSGIRQLYYSIKKLPENIQELIDGQIDFKDGISTAKDEISSQTDAFLSDDTPAVSFASPDKNSPSSVQYILTTPEISSPKQFTVQETQEKEENFFSRFAALFQ